MEISTPALVRLLLPLTPLILKTALLNALSLSSSSSKQDTATAVTVAIIRSLASRKRPLGSIQRLSLRDGGIKGRMWISKTTIPAPVEVDVLEAVIQGIQELGDGTESYTTPPIADVEGEWTGYRSGVSAKEPRLQIPEDEQYARLTSEVSSAVTILYFHGGAYFLMDPSSHRRIVSHLAKRTGGSCFSVRYRLAPQNPFPAQLLDALISYLFLLAPPPGALHHPIPAQHILFAGDSAGGNLAVALLLLILTLRKRGVTSIKFHGRAVALDIPAGVACNSPWLDLTHSMPSIQENACFDYLDLTDTASLSQTDSIADDIWPASPPRAEILCDASMLMHPLVSPMAASPHQWEGMPPVFMCVGNEGLQNGVEVTASRMHRAGGHVQFAGYEGMPHCFAMIFPTTPTAKDCIAKWTGFCVDAVGGKLAGSGHGSWTKAFSKPLRFDVVSLDQISNVADAEVEQSMSQVKSASLAQEADAVKLWREVQSRAKL